MLGGLLRSHFLSASWQGYSKASSIKPATFPEPLTLHQALCWVLGTQAWLRQRESHPCRKHLTNKDKILFLPSHDRVSGAWQVLKWDWETFSLMTLTGTYTPKITRFMELKGRRSSWNPEWVIYCCWVSRPLEPWWLNFKDSSTYPNPWPFFFLLGTSLSVGFYY